MKKDGAICTKSEIRNIYNVYLENILFIKNTDVVLSTLRKQALQGNIQA